MKQPVTKFGRELRRLRVRQGFSQAEMAERWGIDRSQVSNFETRNRLPSPRLVLMFNRAFQVNAFPWVEEDYATRERKATIQNTPVPPAEHEPFLPRGARISIRFEMNNVTKEINLGELYERVG